MNPQLLLEQPNGTGYLCIIFPDTDLPSIDKKNNLMLLSPSALSSSLTENAEYEVPPNNSIIENNGAMNCVTLTSIEVSLEEKQSFNNDDDDDELMIVMESVTSITEPIIATIE